MKIVTPKMMQQIDQEAYLEGFSEKDFMEEAGSGVGLIINDFIDKYGIEKQVILLCGKGNNATDAYIAGIHLLQLDYHVHAYQLFPLVEINKACQMYAERFAEDGGIITEVMQENEINYPSDGIIVDGIFGTGFRGKIEEPIASYINIANSSGLPIIAIDIPSGLNGITGEIEGTTVIAAETAFLGLPKEGFFFREGWKHVGKLRYVNYGLPDQIIETLETELEMLTDEKMFSYLPAIQRDRNKYEAGYVVGLAGSLGMSGAAILSSLAALKAGAGIVRLLYPEKMSLELVASPYEIIKTSYNSQKTAEVIDYLNRASATYIGPGLGKEEETIQLLKTVLPQLTAPCVIDADALTILSKEKIALPAQTIMTPHLGEMARLLKRGKTKEINLDFLKTCQEFAVENKVTLVVKGAPSFIFHHAHPIYVSSVGNPGLATAGTGDVLTGLIAGLLAQKLTPLQAACLGVYIHGVAGELAAHELTAYCMTASDLFDFFPLAFSFSFPNL